MYVISVIMSTYNESEKELKRAIDSILNQTYQEFELILVLDNPANKSIFEIGKHYEEKYHNIKFVPNDKNIGLAKSLNKAVKLAKHPYIARMDADDFSYPNRLEVQIEYLKNGAEMVFSQFCFVDEDYKVLKKSMGLPESSTQMHKILKFRNIISHPTVIMDKQIFEKAGGYSNIKVVEDYDLWYRLMCMEVKMVGVNEILLDYTVRTNSMTTSNYYKAHMAGRYIRKVHKSEQMKKINNSEFENWYSKNSFFEKHYNLSAKKYYTLIQRWSSIRATKYFKLMLIVLQEPRLLKIVFQTIITNYLRKK